MVDKFISPPAITTSGKSGVTLILPFPPSTNHMWRKGCGGRVYLSAEYKAFKETVMMLWRAFGVRTWNPRADVEIELFLYPPWRRRWDLDNRIKTTLDALFNAAIIIDDSQVVKLTAYKNDFDKGRDCAIVKIKRAPKQRKEQK